MVNFQPSAVASAVASASAFAYAGGGGPCDIYAAGGTPCVAAHSSTRALYGNFNGALYQVQRTSDSTTRDIYPRSQGGVAKSDDQDSFCTRTTCVISIIYDQTGNGNHLTQAPPGGAASGPEAGGYDYLAGALGAPVSVNGQRAYGVFISPFSGYRNNNAKNIAVNDDPEGMYMLTDGTHYNTGCCFDYGNAETNSQDTGNGHMEAIYFGTGDGSGRGTGSGSGPWIMADLENGLFTGFDPINNPGNPTMNSRFVTAVVKGQPGNWAIRGGNGQNGGLQTIYDGKRPDNGYNPMKKEGAIILGIGGDNSNHAQGTFYEGVMTKGYPSSDVENAVQQNIVSARYGLSPRSTGPKLNTGSSVSFRVTTPGYTDRYISHSGSTVNTQVVSSSSGSDQRRSATWIVRTGLADSDCFSFESKDQPGNFIRHSNYQLQVNNNDNSKIFHEDATFCTQDAINGQGTTFRSWSYAARVWRHYNSLLYIASNGTPHDYDARASFDEDVSFVVSSSLA